MEQRAKSNNRRFNVHDLAADIWDAAELEDATPLANGSRKQPESNSLAIIPDEHPATLTDDVMFSQIRSSSEKRQSYLDCQSRGQAELVVRLANLGISGDVKLPADLAPCLKLLDRLNRRMERAAARFTELAESRTGDERVRQQLIEVLERWFVLDGNSPTVSRRLESEPEPNDADRAG